jgi:hypothetical protein
VRVAGTVGHLFADLVATRARHAVGAAFKTTPICGHPVTCAQNQWLRPSRPPQICAREGALVSPGGDGRARIRRRRYLLRGG